MTEEEFVDRLIELTGGADTSLIGDDAALISAFEPPLLLTNDTLNRSVHYDQSFSPSQLGQKLAAVNLSDIAAMGGRPGWAVFSLSSRRDPETQHSICEGLVDRLNRSGTPLAGGDLSATPEGFESLSLTILGRALPDGVLRRDRARPGDVIYVSGPLGGGAAVLEQTGTDRSPRDQRLLYDLPDRLTLGQQAVEAGVRCGMDVTDGLLKDLKRICRASGVGARLDWNTIPIHERARELEQKNHDALRWALTGGEDCELLMTLPEPELAESLGRGSVIGEITDAQTLSWDPSLPPEWEDLPSEGYDHFENIHRGS